MTYVLPQTSHQVIEQIDHYQWDQKTFPWLYAAEVEVAEQRTLTPAYLLYGAIAALEVRGRCRGDFERGDGRVCQMGALAVAAGHDADIWRLWRDLTVEELDEPALVLVAAAKILAKVEAPLQPVHEMSLGRLVTLLGDSNDVASDAEILDFLAKAAHEAARLAEKAGAGA